MFFWGRMCCIPRRTVLSMENGGVEGGTKNLIRTWRRLKFLEQIWDTIANRGKGTRDWSRRSGLGLVSVHVSRRGLKREKDGAPGGARIGMPPLDF